MESIARRCEHGFVSLTASLALLVAAVALLGIAEYAAHRRSLSRVPIRIHVNGTRGKSSVVRLIAAALRADGRKVFAKTTGTLPRLIADDAQEYPVYRPGRTNVIEQLRIISLAAGEGAEVMVLECMALQPYLQSLCELKMIRSTHGVISNAWPDHLDVMGPGVREVALALAGTTPVAGKLFTVERDHLEIFEAACDDRGSQLVALGADEIGGVSDDELARFPYIEHRENVALALAVSSSLGVPRELALAAMATTQPDVGALREVGVEFFGRDVTFVNGFAANDPVATERIWRMTLDRHGEAASRLMVINCRLDRPDRSRQLGQALADWPPADRYLLIGTGTYALARTAVRHGVPAGVLLPLESSEALDIFEEIMSLCRGSAVVLGAGNIAGVGLDLVRLFDNRSRPREAA